MAAVICITSTWWSFSCSTIISVKVECRSNAFGPEVGGLITGSRARESGGWCLVWTLVNIMIRDLSPDDHLQWKMRSCSQLLSLDCLNYNCLQQKQLSKLSWIISFPCSKTKSLLQSAVSVCSSPSLCCSNKLLLPGLTSSAVWCCWSVLLNVEKYQ